MATTAIDTEPTLSPTVRSSLRSLRTLIRVYVWLEGLAAGATWLGMAFWATLLIDWFFEPPPVVRGAMLAVVAVVLAGVLVQLIVRRTFVRLSNSNMAMLLERRFAELDDSLLTAVVLTARTPDPTRCSRQMLAQTCRRAAERIGAVQVRKVFNSVPLQRVFMAAALLGASVASLAGLSATEGRFSGVFGVWARRCLLFSPEPWPRRAAIVVEGFDSGVAKVARGDDLEIIARADARKELPQTVQVHYRIEGGRRDRDPMVRVGSADPGMNPFQEYSYTFEGILTARRFDVVGEVRWGRDVRVRDLRIEVVDSPTVNSMALKCTYPRYMGRQPREFPVAGVMQIPQGTAVTIQARANKDLVGVRIDHTAGEQSLGRTELDRSDLADDGRSFDYRLPSLDENTTLLFTLSDTDGITGREPVPLVLAAVPDRAPQLTARLSGISMAITPQARLPVAGRISDDYGVAEVWFEYAIDQQDPAVHPLDVPVEHPASLPLDGAALEVRDLNLSPGQKLLVGLKAADLCDLSDAPNVGTSERWLLDLVTPEQLRAMLQSRELVLRQRFEVIIQEVTETRDLLLRIDFAGAEADGPSSEAAAEAEELSAQRQSALRTWRIQRALTNSGKNAHETLGVADGFDDIRLQLINNRIDTAELIERLEEGIAKPLYHVAREMFPLLQTRLERLHESLDDETLGSRRRDLAREQADAILWEMQKVLDRMIELEDFNEAIELLRAIIQMQEQVEEQTRQRHRETIRDLLEGER